MIQEIICYFPHGGTERALNHKQLQTLVNQNTTEKKKNLTEKNLSLNDNEIIIVSGLGTTVPNAWQASE